MERAGLREGVLGVGLASAEATEGAERRFFSAVAKSSWVLLRFDADPTEERGGWAEVRFLELFFCDTNGWGFLLICNPRFISNQLDYATRCGKLTY